MARAFTVDAAGRVPYAETLSATGIPGLALAPGCAPPDDGDWPRGRVYVYAAGRSVRPVEVRYDGRSFSARVATPSSPLDYRIALRLAMAAAGAAQRPISGPDGQALPPSAFARTYDRDWIRRNCLAGLKALVRRYRARREPIVLRGARVELAVGPRFLEPLLAQPQRLAHVFFERLRRLNYIDGEADVRFAPMADARDSRTGQSMRVCRYRGEHPTLLSDEAAWVALQGSGDDNGDELFVAIDDLAELLGDSAQWLGEHHLLVPALDSEDWLGLRERASQHRAMGIEIDAQRGETSETEDFLAIFGELSWQALTSAPMLAFAVVAGAERPLGRRAIRRFKRALDEAAAYGPLMQAVVEDARARVDDVLAGTDGRDSAALETLRGVANALETGLDRQRALRFKLALIDVTKRAAETRPFPGMAPRLRPAQKTALTQLVAALNISP